MGAIKDFNIQQMYSFGDKYEKFNLSILNSLQSLDTVKLSKEGKNSIFSSKYVNNSNKEDIEKIFNYIDTNKDNNLTYRELFNSLADMVYSVSENSHIDTKQLNKYLQKNNINLKDVNSVLAFLKATQETTDISKNIQTGKFNINGQQTFLAAKKVDVGGSIENSRTYRLTDENGNNFHATFGGQNPQTQKMVSEFYAQIFNKPELVINTLTYNDTQGNVEGVVNSEIKSSSLDKNKKLGLDIFFSNDENSDNISFFGTLDETSRSFNTTFSFIPTEFNTLLSNGKFYKEDIIKAMETIVSISDEDIKSTLAKYNNTKRYEDILLKRKDFCNSMLENMKNTPQNKNESIQDYVQRVETYTIQSALYKAKDKFDIKAYKDALELINDDKAKQSLSIQTKNTRAYLNRDISKIEYASDKELPPLSEKNFIGMLAQYGYAEGLDDKSLSNILGNGYTNHMKSAMREYANNPDMFIDMVNNMRKLGIDVTKNKDSFDKFLVFCGVMDLNRIENLDENTYDMAINTFTRSKPNPIEQEAIDFYKSEASYRDMHAGTGLLYDDDIEPTPEIKQKMDHLNDYLHKHKTQTDIEVYRGSQENVFNNIQLPDGSDLGERLIVINERRYEYNGDETPADLKKNIDEVLDFINNNGVEIKSNRFLSTTIDKEVINNFGAVGLKLDLPAGSSAACIDAVNFNGICAGEGEVLLSYGSIQKITGAYFDEEMHRLVFTGEIVTDKY